MFTLGTFRGFRLAIVSWVLSFSVFGQQENVEVAEDLTLRMIDISNSTELKAVVEFSEADLVGFFISKSENFDQLQVCTDSEFRVWVQNRLQFADTKCWEINQDRLFSLSSSDSVYIVLQTDEDFESLNAHTFRQKTQRPELSSVILPKLNQSSGSFIIIIFLASMLIFGTIRNSFPNVYQDIFTINPFGRISGSRQDGVDFGIILLSFFISLLCAFAYWYLRDFSSNYYLDSFTGNLGRILFYTGIVMISLLIKYYFVSLVSRLTGFKGIAYSQMYDFLRFFALLSLLFAFLIFGKFWFSQSPKDLSGWFWSYYFVTGYLLFVVYYFYKIGVQMHHRKLHIISYLCTTEILGAVLIALIFTR